MLFVISVLFAVGCCFLILSDLFGDDWLSKLGTFLADTAKVIFVGVPLVAYEMLKPVVLASAIVFVIAGVASLFN
jgi:hypothetical protein